MKGLLTALCLSRLIALALPEDRSYLLIGVSGGLQDGFPDHDKLHFKSSQEQESRAIFLGRGLVRGYKAYLDVMQEGWRQYTKEPEQPLINSVVLASGCNEHANEYWVYIVDVRQVHSILLNEPRFLSITPDTGLVDLTADETSPAVKAFAQREIELQGKSDKTRVAIPIVTAVWYHESFVPSPSIHVKDDGTHVTNFPNSLALWAEVDDTGRTACDISNEQCASLQGKEAHQSYWDGIRRAIRRAEEQRPSNEESQREGPPFECKERARFGVGPDTARIYRSFSAQELQNALNTSGYKVDFVKGTLVPDAE